uniref:BPTI/Kunitz inhibitor domain-containing protein n=1 Tax=Podarcis muralis TaxID=64176 RepID=A0A670IG50_PODMU
MAKQQQQHPRTFCPQTCSLVLNGSKHHFPADCCLLKQSFKKWVFEGKAAFVLLVSCPPPIPASHAAPAVFLLTLFLSLPAMRCPSNLKEQELECGPKCTSHSNCPGEQMCCRYGCQRRCVLPVNDLCNLPRDPGSCNLSLDYFYYHTRTKKCRRFKYSGCKGNSNRFYTRKDCMDVCGENQTRWLLTTISWLQILWKEGCRQSKHCKYSSMKLVILAHLCLGSGLVMELNWPCSAFLAEGRGKEGGGHQGVPSSLSGF